MGRLGVKAPTLNCLVTVAFRMFGSYWCR